jgi:hypothetical protein
MTLGPSAALLSARGGTVIGAAALGRGKWPAGGGWLRSGSPNLHDKYGAAKLSHQGVQPLSRNKPRSRQEHVNLTLRVTEELLEHLDGWRLQQILRPSRNATVVAILEEWISGKAPGRHRRRFNLLERGA